jgi:hypothetical protein
MVNHSTSRIVKRNLGYASERNDMKERWQSLCRVEYVTIRTCFGLPIGDWQANVAPLGNQLPLLTTGRFLVGSALA